MSYKSAQRRGQRFCKNFCDSKFQNQPFRRKFCPEMSRLPIRNTHFCFQKEVTTTNNSIGRPKKPWQSDVNLFENLTFYLDRIQGPWSPRLDNNFLQKKSIQQQQQQQLIVLHCWALNSCRKTPTHSRTTTSSFWRNPRSTMVLNVHRFTIWSMCNICSPPNQKQVNTCHVMQ